jgi:hypothetical protein
MKQINFIDGKQAKVIHQYKNIEQKLLKTSANIWFNKMCKTIQNNVQGAGYKDHAI